jgi:5-methylcytosine-specific restriction enzyme subunit McrC
MTGGERAVLLDEWTTLEAAHTGPGQAMLGLHLRDPAIHHDVEMLTRRGAMVVRGGELGLSIETKQHIGTVMIGPLRVTVRPKLEVGRLWTIVAYAFRLRDLVIPQQVLMSTPEGGFADLLVSQLVIEAAQLRRQGLRKNYLPREEWLASPRGRIGFAELSRRMPLIEARLPCAYHDRTTNISVNQLVLAGLRLGARLAVDRHVRMAAQSEAGEWSEFCNAPAVSATLIQEVERTRSRLTTAYSLAHRLVMLLFAACGTSNELEGGSVSVRGFLWDMSKIFERFVRRFVEEFAPPGMCIDAQEVLHELYSVAKPALRKPPRPQPDLVVRNSNFVTGVFDTKYRDLATRDLPREQLYQLSVYALAFAGQGGASVPATILYPKTFAGPAKDEIIHLHLHGRSPAMIALRAIDWVGAADLLSQGASPLMKGDLAGRWLAVPTA